jgi:hypothetical protein
VEEKVRASLLSAKVGELDGKQRRRIGNLETSVPRWFMGRARVGGSYRQVRGPVYFETFEAGAVGLVGEERERPPAHLGK